ncbi:hypothetical protein U9R62_14750 [Cylindrospermopsis raciborskii DSH]|uniref:hypothetical protein n=1 Tax=Cylindrospermopsis raciborskii TaxID=77022 RepID=UPI002ED88098
MANISISDLRPAGVDFFSDSESYLNEITESEINSIIGASTFLFPIVIRVAIPYVCNIVIKIGK